MPTEAMFWLGVILISPAFQTIGRLLGKFVLDFFIPDDRLVVTYTDKKGVKHSEIVDISNDEELAGIIEDIKLSSSSGTKKRAVHL